MKIRFSLWLFMGAVLMLPLFTITSCSEAKKLAAFDVIYTFPKIYFIYAPKDQKLPEVTLYTGKLSINFDSILSAHYIPSGIIASAYLLRLAMDITAPPEATFNWLESVRMVGSADSTFQQTTDLGAVTGIDPGAKIIDLATENVDIKPILFKNSYYLKIFATPSGQIPASSSINMYLDSKVKLHIEPL
ncbi:MAG: hypothetical protein ABSE72_05470 [Bacteroidales bacterium]